MLSTAKSSFTVPTTTLSGSSSTWKSELSGIVPPEVIAVSRAPRRPRSTPLTSSRWISAPRRPRRVVKPSASMRSTDAKVSRCKIAVWPGAPDQREQLGLAPVLRIDLGRDLLSEHVERRHRHDQPVEFAAIDAVDQRRAFDEVVSGERETAGPSAGRRRCGPSGRRAAGSCDRARRAELADQIDVADIDAELERGGRHHGGECADFQPLLGIEPLFLGEAAVMRGDAHLAEPVGELASG